MGGKTISYLSPDRFSMLVEYLLYLVLGDVWLFVLPRGCLVLGILTIA